MDDATRLTTGERVLIFLQIPGAIIFGLGPFLIPGIMLPFLGYAGDDPFIAWAAGAAVFGYAAGAFLAMRQDEWIAARLLVLATLVFHAITLVLCVFEFAAGAVHPIVNVIFANSALQTVVALWLLVRHRSVHSGKPNIPREAIGLMMVSMLAAGGTGLGALLLPATLGHLAGLHATDVLVYRLTGAATVGYAAMAIVQLRTRHWAEMRISVIMAFVFNGLGQIAAAISLRSGDPPILPAIVFPATLIVTPGALYAVLRMDAEMRSAAQRLRAA
jgi:hypothetical protein